MPWKDAYRKARRTRPVPNGEFRMPSDVVIPDDELLARVEARLAATRKAEAAPILSWADHVEEHLRREARREAERREARQRRDEDYARKAQGDGSSSSEEVCPPSTEPKVKSLVRRVAEVAVVEVAPSVTEERPPPLEGESLDSAMEAATARGAIPRSLGRAYQRARTLASSSTPTPVERVRAQFRERRLQEVASREGKSDAKVSTSEREEEESAEKRASEEAARELEATLRQQDQGPFSPLVEEIASGDRTRVLRTREDPEGQVPPANAREVEVPAMQPPPMMPIESAPDRGPMEWDEEASTPPPLEEVRVRSRTGAKRRPYNPRRHLELDDYVSVNDGRRSSASTPPPPYQRSNPAKSRYPIKTRGVMFGGLVPVPIDPTVDPPVSACFNCWQRDHRRQDCPRPKVGVYCLNCGRRGETLQTCPRCKEPHQRYLRENFGDPARPSRRDDTSRTPTPPAVQPRSQSRTSARSVRSPVPSEEVRQPSMEELATTARVLESLERIGGPTKELVLEALFRRRPSQDEQ